MSRRLHLLADKRRTAMDSSLAIVNIVLLLIFFFLATGSIQNSDAVEIPLPETSDLPLDLLPKPLLMVDTDGTLVLDGVPVQAGTLAGRLVDQPILNLLVDREDNAVAILSALSREKLIAVELRLVTLHRDAVELAE